MSHNNNYKVTGSSAKSSPIFNRTPRPTTELEFERIAAAAAEEAAGPSRQPVSQGPKVGGSRKPRKKSFATVRSEEEERNLEKGVPVSANKPCSVPIPGSEGSTATAAARPGPSNAASAPSGPSKAAAAPSGPSNDAAAPLHSNNRGIYVPPGRRANPPTNQSPLSGVDMAAPRARVPAQSVRFEPSATGLDAGSSAPTNRQPTSRPIGQERIGGGSPSGHLPNPGPPSQSDAEMQDGSKSTSSDTESDVYMDIESTTDAASQSNHNQSRWINTSAPAGDSHEHSFRPSGGTGPSSSHHRTEQNFGRRPSVKSTGLSFTGGSEDLPGNESLDAINGNDLDTDSPTYIGWCGGGINKRNFFVLNAGLPCEQYVVEQTADEEHRAHYIGVDVDLDGFFSISDGTPQCWEDIQFCGACWVPHGQNCHLYYLVTWLGCPEHRFAVTLDKLTKLRRSHSLRNAKRVTKTDVLDRVTSWATDKMSVDGFDESLQMPHQVLEIYHQRRSLANHIAQGPKVGRAFSSGARSSSAPAFDRGRRTPRNVPMTPRGEQYARSAHNAYVNRTEFSNLAQDVVELKRMLAQFLHSQGRGSASQGASPRFTRQPSVPQAERQARASQHDRRQDYRGKQRARESATPYPADPQDYAQTYYNREYGLDSEYPDPESPRYRSHNY